MSESRFPAGLLAVGQVVRVPACACNRGFPADAVARTPTDPLDGAVLGKTGQLRLVCDGFVRQVVKEAASARKLFGNVLDELLVAALGVDARAALGVLGNGRGVREPEADVHREGLGQELQVTLGTCPGPTETIEAAQDERRVGGSVEVLPERGLN
jgi:hypothetical protein